MKMLFGGLIAVVLLGLYAYSICYAILVVSCLATQGCTIYTKDNFTDGMVLALTVIGGLVSALVIAELAITKPGEVPLARAFATDPTPSQKKLLYVVTGLYLLVWLAAGLSAFIVGSMQHPGRLQPLTDLGQTWLGLAVAAGYAYFGIKPQR